ncbi:MAG TPA: NUDIX domain-containing protein [Candidatus Saccharimonadia bacterium]|nr:NUDIX domain-containing protein [Candidatus Saccharimonadia bacterium]
MKTVLMAIAVIRQGDRILLRKFDPAKNPYDKPWGLFGGRLEGDGTVVEMLNRELLERWNMTVTISEQLTWDEDQKADHDGEVKRFIYLDALCELASGEPKPVNPNEELKWAAITELASYEHVPPSERLLKKLGYF